MIDIAKLKIGDKVHYQQMHDESQYENGVVKVIKDDVISGVWVVYNCDGQWDKFMEYTGALTNLSDLRLGWRHD